MTTQPGRSGSVGETRQRNTDYFLDIKAAYTDSLEHQAAKDLPQAQADDNNPELIQIEQAHTDSLGHQVVQDLLQGERGRRI